MSEIAVGAPKGKKRGSKAGNRSAVTKAEALEITQSALSYCQQAGLKLMVANDGGRCILVLEGVELRGEHLVLLDVPPPAPVAEERPKRSRKRAAAAPPPAPETTTTGSAEEAPATSSGNSVG